MKNIFFTSLLSASLFLFLPVWSCVTPGSATGGKSTGGKSAGNGEKTDPHGPKGGKTAKGGEKTDPGEKRPPKTGEKGEKTAEVFVTDQPEFPVEEDDAYFKKTAARGLVFRVLITGGNYQVRQLGFRENIRRKRDPNGDRSQVSHFRGWSDRYNFADLDFIGEMRVRLNPHNGTIELIKFVEGKTPQASQAALLFKNDLSRFVFDFPKHVVSPREFRIQYLWRIKKRPGLSDEEARKQLLEFLKTQLRKH